VIEAIQFDRQFENLCAAYGTTKAVKTKDSWFEEFEKCDYFTFCRAIKILRRGDKFPNLGMVWDTYKPLLPDNLRVKESEGCDDCENGRVFYVDFVLSRHDGPYSDRILSYSLVANCAVCSKDVLSRLVNICRAKLQRQENGEYWTQRALKALPDELRRVEEENKNRHEKWKKEWFSMRHAMREI